MNFFPLEPKFDVNRARFPREKKTQEFTKMGEIHELFVWPFLWFGLPGRLLIEPKLFSRRFSAYGGDRVMVSRLSGGLQTR